MEMCPELVMMPRIPDIGCRGTVATNEGTHMKNLPAAVEDGAMRAFIVTCIAVAFAAGSGSPAGGAVNFSGVNVASVASESGQDFAYTVDGSARTETLNVRLIAGQASSLLLQPGDSPDQQGFYALQSSDLTPATFRFTFDVARTFRVDENETMASLERNTFLLPASNWAVLAVSEATVTGTGSSVSFVGNNQFGPYGSYAIQGSSATFDLQIVNSPGFPVYGSAISLSIVPEPGDFNHDAVVNAADIDLLCDAIHNGGPVGLYDVNNDDFLNMADLTFEVKTILQTDFGDADTDGDVDLADLGNLATGFGQPGERRWSRGNFDCDDDVDLNDLGTLATNFQSSQARTFVEFDALVPEPGALSLFGLGAIVLRRRSHQP
jgi:hypothetical protein